MSERFTVKELAERAGVTPRTVYYYVGEGLLPPPEGGGPATTYSDDHLARLRLIRRLKDEYLPLAEIRRRLADLSRDEIEELLAGPSPPPDSAREYLARLLSSSSARPEVQAVSARPASVPVSPPVASVADAEPNVAGSRTVPSEAPTPVEQSDWRRIRIGQDLELHIRRDAPIRRKLQRIVEAIRPVLET